MPSCMPASIHIESSVLHIRPCVGVWPGSGSRFASVRHSISVSVWIPIQKRVIKPNLVFVSLHIYTTLANNFWGSKFRECPRIFSLVGLLSNKIDRKTTRRYNVKRDAICQNQTKTCKNWWIFFVFIKIKKTFGPVNTLLFPLSYACWADDIIWSDSDVRFLYILFFTLINKIK